MRVDDAGYGHGDLLYYYGTTTLITCSRISEGVSPRFRLLVWIDLFGGDEKCQYSTRVLYVSCTHELVASGGDKSTWLTDVYISNHTMVLAYTSTSQLTSPHAVGSHSHAIAAWPTRCEERNFCSPLIDTEVLNM
jgi:hypothetical protein